MLYLRRAHRCGQCMFVAKQIRHEKYSYSFPGKFYLRLQACCQVACFKWRTSMRLVSTCLLLMCLGASIESQEAPAKGTKNSPVTILEFSDFECPFSARAAPIIDELIRTNPGKIRLVFRHNPLPFHQHSVLAHEAALASAAQGKFWEMHELFFANEAKLTQH